MKIFYYLPIILFFASCKCKKDTITENSETKSNQVSNLENMIKSTNPEDGKCTTEIFRNKSLDIKTSELGAIYYDKIDNLETSVILYKYERNVPKDVQDASYREEIVFEINNSDKELNLKNEDLQKTKMLFGRWCYCKGTTGNYVINDGKLHLTQKNEQVKFDLEFKNNKVPQIILAIAETVK